jgi:large subunit ribosomal protein L29
MKFSEIRDLTVEELRKREKAMRTELFEMKMKHSLGQVSNPLQVRSLRRNVAKIKTALTAKLAR